MRFLLPAVAALLPIVIAPGVLFYFDVTPKLVILLIGVSAALILWRGDLPLKSRANRIFFLLLAAQAVVLGISTAMSVHPALSLNGGNWRRFGLLSQLAVLLFGALVAIEVATNRNRVTLYLKAIVIGGLPVALFGILQYFGWDPWLPVQPYHIGDVNLTIVRPPSTLGHASYFATYLLVVIFAAAWLVRQAIWRVPASVTAVLCGAAIILSGTRAALVGLLAGTIVALWSERPSLQPKPRSVLAVVAAAAAALLIFIAFYLSPAGQGIRSRVTWVSQEPLGGARPLLWRDSLRMSVHHLALGYGPETFIREFPQNESIELARAFPDFLHESPHNIFLDALVSQGIPGILLLAALCSWGLWLGSSDSYMKGALIAMIVAQLFIAFVVPTAVFFNLILALLVRPEPTRRIPLVWVAASCCALVFTAYAIRLLVTDRALSVTNAALDRRDLQSAVTAHQQVLKWEPAGSSAELFYSRRLIDIAGKSPDIRIKAQAAREGAASALNATWMSEETANAWFNLAGFLSLTNSPADVERSLREAIRSAPYWYKPHWLLAQVLVAEHRLDEAGREAETAVNCNLRQPELLHTLENIRAAQRQLK